MIRLAILAPALLLTGCAGYHLTPLSPDVAAQMHDTGKEHKEGYIFYAPQPFLLGNPNQQGNYEFKLIYLPDYARPYRFTQYEFFAKSDLKIAFEDGWKFTGADSKVDTTAALSSLVELAKGAIKTASTTKPSPVLYRVEWDSTAKKMKLERTEMDGL
jgi:hypothetical protein